ncbi:MAG: molybdopterin converting factor subunit 1 [Deltaproteobacteria bacterium]|nr:molybdopterin converting factor subunit 1 [Deltaproteobacteria bacterium]
MSKIRITIKFFASMRDAIGERERTLLLPEGSNVDYVLEDLKNQYPQLAKVIDCSFIALNEEYTLKHTLLKEGDTLAIIPPVSGG